MKVEATMPLPAPDLQNKRRVLALIAARGGSKRLPGKNIRNLGGKPLIAWTIDIALESRLYCDVLVSTDNAAIAEVAKKHGALVPWLRPADLATDTAGSVDVALHALDWYEANHGKVDGLALLQPTSPFRTQKTLKESLDLFLSSGCRPVVSVTPALSHPAWCFSIHEDHLEPFLGWEEADKRSQDLPPAFVTDGSMYIISPTCLRSERRFVNNRARAYIVKADEALDIDTSEDWEIAEQIAAGKFA